MQPVEIRPSIYWIGVNDRQTERFEGLWPIHEEGISYNSFLIRDQKNAIIDLSSKQTTDEFFEQISSLIDPAAIDYVVINHMEPDHTGSLKALIQAAPQVKLLGSKKTVEMLASFFGITQNVQAVADGEELSLGTCTLKFLSTPFIHWPETIMTYETSQKMLFSCDGFGGFGALNGTIFDDGNIPLAWYEEQALRYFVNIVASFSKMVTRTAARLADLPIEIVAPSHGLVWRGQPRRIIDLYNTWAGYAGQPGDPGVTLLYASMYGNTARAMEVVAQGIADEGLPVAVFDVSRASTSSILTSLWLKRGVVVGSPTYEGCLFPSVLSVLEMAKTKHITGKILAGFGSRAWGGGGQRRLIEESEALKWQFYESFEFDGAPKSADLQQARAFGAAFARQLNGN